jgi:Reverse transcriptase (RNA-dependent DNA polymerase)
MATSTPQATKATIILDRPSDWDEWFSIVKRMAVQSHIFDLVDPAAGTQPKTLEKPTNPTVAMIKQGAKMPIDLSKEELVAYQLAREEFKYAEKDYAQESGALKELSNHIVTTVSRLNYSFISKEETPWGMLSALRKRLAPTDRARQLDLARQYQELKKTPRAQQLDRWLQSWEKTYKECLDNKLPEVTDERPVYDFLLAIKGIDPTYAGVQEVLINEKIKNNNAPTIFDVIEDFRNHQRINKATVKSASHTAFATFQGREQQEVRQPPGNCPCGEFHWFSQCPYLIEELRTSDWSPDPRIEEEIKEKLEKSTTFREAVENAKNYRQGIGFRSKQRAKGQKKPNEQKQAGQKKKVEKKADSQSSEESSTTSILGACHAAFAVNRSEYKLHHCWTLDCASDAHVCNDRSRFTFERMATENDTLYAGKEIYPIEAFGTVDIVVDTPSGKAPIRLLNVVLVPGFLTNLVSLRRIKEKGFSWDMEKDRIHRKGKTLCYVKSVDDHWVLEDNSHSSLSAFAVSTAPRAPLKATPEKWHAILGHPNSTAITKLENATEGAKVTDAVSSSGNCVTCHLSKAHEIVSRRPGKEDPALTPLARVSYDLIEFAPAYNNEKWVSHFRCYYTTMDWVYTHTKKSQAVDVVKEFINMVHTRYNKSIRYLRTDGERSLGRIFDDFIATQGITTERSALDTPAQNGGAERAGGVIVRKARCIRITSSLPSSMWPEAIKAAGYLNNRTPKCHLKWKTPIEALTGNRPNLSHLHVYGCRAYPLNKKIPRRQKLEPRAHIGYLVGYDASNIYRVWIPSQEKVIRTRDVTFDDTLFYDPSELDLGHILREEVEHAVEVIDMPSPVMLPSSSAADDELAGDLQDTPFSAGSTQANENPENDKENAQNDAGENILTPKQLPTPQATPAPTDDTLHTPNPSGPSADFDTRNILPAGEKRTRVSSRRAAYVTALSETSTLSAYHAAFATGIDSTGVERRLHRDAMPPEPRTWREMLAHQHAAEYKKAAQKEIQDLEKRGTFKYVPIDSATTMRLPLKWVFKNKYDSDGYLEKFKARICVRGDLQKTEEDTYAATLAARTFRALLAIAAAFDLEVNHYDAINAFVNADVDEEIYCRAPDGFERSGLCWRLLRALYGLKQSPLLWYMVFTAALEELGLSEVPGVNCLFSNEWLILFFYVDDIVMLCATRDLPRLRKFTEALLNRFEMRSLEELKWFLGIRVIRDRPNRRIWLCQDSYIKKIANKFNITETKSAPKTPLPSAQLLPSEGQAPAQQIHAYQQRVGSIGFAAVMTRPDISHAVSNLSQFLKNPSSKHLDASERVISYLLNTRTLAIEYSVRQEGEIFMAASDAAFADDPETRKSSDGYLFQLYGGPIDWRAAKQRTVTTSSTEAELLSLTVAAKEFIWWNRFFSNIRFNMKQRLSIACDNLQTIGILEKDSLKLTTKLRHVDIHQHWLRQEVEAGRISIRWIPTAEMPADGLTKPLSAQKHEAFVKQLNLVDIQEKLNPIRQLNASEGK